MRTQTTRADLAMAKRKLDGDDECTNAENEYACVALERMQRKRRIETAMNAISSLIGMTMKEASNEIDWETIVNERKRWHERTFHFIPLDYTCALICAVDNFIVHAKEDNRSEVEMKELEENVHIFIGILLNQVHPCLHLLHEGEMMKLIGFCSSEMQTKLHRSDVILDYFEEKEELFYPSHNDTGIVSSSVSTVSDDE